MFERIKKIIATQLNVPADKIKPETRMIEDLSIDSLDMVEMIMTIESEFGISITDEQITSMQTVQDIIDFCNKLSGN